MEQVTIPARFCVNCGRTDPDEKTHKLRECCSIKTKRCQIRVFLNRKDAKTWGD